MDRTGPQGLALLLVTWATTWALSRHLSQPEEPHLEDGEGTVPSLRLLGGQTRDAHTQHPAQLQAEGPGALVLTLQSFNKHSACFPDALVRHQPGALPINERTN